MGTIKCTDLCKNYRQKKVLDNVNLTIEEGKIYGLIGRNGAGKTTTFYMIVGLEHPDRGTVHLDELEVTHLPMYKRALAGIGYLPQEASIFRKLTVEENLLAILEDVEPDGKKRQEKLGISVRVWERPFPAVSAVVWRLPVPLQRNRPSSFLMNLLQALTPLPWPISRSLSNIWPNAALASSLRIITCGKRSASLTRPTS